MLLPLADNRPEIRYAWCGSSALVVDTKGRAGLHPLSGFYFRQCRFLKDLRFLINGKEPYPCSICEVDPTTIELTYIHPEVERGGGGGSGSGGLGSKDDLLFRDLDVRLTYKVRPASLLVTFKLANRWQNDLELDVACVLSADYATVDEAQFNQAESRAPVEALAASPLTFTYKHPELPFETRVTDLRAQGCFDDGQLQYHVRLERQATLEIELDIQAIDQGMPITREDEDRREARLDGWHRRVARVYTPGETPLVDMTNRALHDLGSSALLDGPANEWLTPAAGFPLYQSLWGRDALTASWQAGLFDGGEMIRDVLHCLGRSQARTNDPTRDEQPGRIIDQAKTDVPSRLGETPFDRYYADVASPFMFIIAYGFGYVLTGSKELLDEHWGQALRVLEWVCQYGDRDGDGYIEYLTTSPVGPTHQAWKDSENAIVDEHGEHVAPPIAACEIQGYYYSALQYMAGLALVRKELKLARALWREARHLKTRFNRDFWMDDEGYITFGLDSDKRPIRAITSNAAHCLPTGIISKRHIPRLVRRMFQPDLFSGWGIRTLSTLNPAYQPLDYHLGSVWPVENGTIVFGLRRYGLNDHALLLSEALYDLARLWPGGRSPECVGGYGRNEFSHPGVFPRANRPQTWNQSVLPLLVQCILGIVPIGPAKMLLVDPIMPAWLPDITLQNVQVGGASVSLHFWRDGKGNSHYKVLNKTGKVRVLRQRWLERL